MDLTPTQSHAESVIPPMGLALFGDDCGPTLLMVLTLTQSPTKPNALLMDFSYSETVVDLLC